MTVRRLRVILRLVWRAERADWRSSVFSVALLALAIAVGFVTIVAARSLSDEGYQWVGYAGDAQATVEFSDDPGVREAVEERFGPPDALRETFFLRGTADRGHTIVVILDGTTLGASAFPLMAGRLPGAGEAAINRADDRFADVSIGDEVAAMVGVDGSLEVVGVFNSTHASATVLVAESSGRVDWNADFVRIVLLYSDVTADFKQLPDWSVVHVGPATAVLRHYLPASATSEIDSSPWAEWMRSVSSPIVVTPYGLVVFVVVATMLTGIRRRLRSLGVLEATAGGEPGDLARYALAAGTVIGLAGVVVGLILGVAAINAVLSSQTLIRLISRAAGIEAGYSGHSVQVLIGVRDFVVPAVLGISASVAASLVAVVRLRKLTTVEALASRLPLRPPNQWLAPGGLIMFMVGFVLSLGPYYGLESMYGPGWALMMLGGALLAPSAIGLLVKTRLPFGPEVRIVMRDAARHWDVTSSAVAVSGFILGAFAFLAIGSGITVFGVALTIGLAIVFVLPILGLRLLDARSDVALLQALGATPRIGRRYASTLAGLTMTAAAAVSIPLSMVMAYSLNPALDF